VAAPEPEAPTTPGATTGRRATIVAVLTAVVTAAVVLIAGGGDSSPSSSGTLAFKTADRTAPAPGTWRATAIVATSNVENRGEVFVRAWSVGRACQNPSSPCVLQLTRQRAAGPVTGRLLRTKDGWATAVNEAEELGPMPGLVHSSIKLHVDPSGRHLVGVEHEYEIQPCECHGGAMLDETIHWSAVWVGA
jgi:hypothetical protein